MGREAAPKAGPGAISLSYHRRVHKVSETEALDVCLIIRVCRCCMASDRSMCGELGPEDSPLPDDILQLGDIP